MENDKFSTKFLLSLIVMLVFASSAQAQTDLRISGPQAGFPVALPQLCDAGGAGDAARQIPEIINKDLNITGLFKVLNPATFVETPGKCSAPDGFAFSDWTVIGAEGLVRGEVSQKGKSLSVKLYLFDVLQQRAVVGKQYNASTEDVREIAHRFANEVMLFFTGEAGVFGTKITYVSKVGRFKELFIMDIDGSNQRQLTKGKGLAISPAWAPGGDRIVYTSYRSRKPELYLISPEGGAPRQITKREGLELGAEFAKDGTTLIASATVKGISNLVKFDLRGTMLNSITRGSAIDVSPSLSPDGRRIVFCSNRGGGPQIYVMGVDGGSARRISYANSNYCTSPVWSPKGDKVAFVCRQGGNQLFMASPEGTQTAQLTFYGNNEDPSWSPDGRYLAYSTNFGRGGAKNIAILSLLGGSPVQVTFSKSEASQPAWSPRM